jgi:ribosomal protein L37AE/L43A
MPSPERAHTLPDGRDVRAVHEGEPAGWVVWLVGREGARVAARDIHDALAKLLAPNERPWPAWFVEAANALAALDTEAGRRYGCPCCGRATLTEAPTGTYEICKECGWEDDPVQFHDPDYRGGANSESLHEARARHRARRTR